MVPYAQWCAVGRESVKTCFRKPGAATPPPGARHLFCLLHRPDPPPPVLLDSDTLRKLARLLAEPLDAVKTYGGVCEGCHDAEPRAFRTSLTTNARCPSCPLRGDVCRGLGRSSSRGRAAHAVVPPARGHFEEGGGAFPGVVCGGRKTVPCWRPISAISAGVSFLTGVPEGEPVARKKSSRPGGVTTHHR